MNDLWGTPFCAGIAVGAPGVTVGQTFAYTAPSAAMRDNPAYLAQLKPKAPMTRVATPEPWVDFAFDGNVRVEGLLAGQAPRLDSVSPFVPSPNGQALTACYGKWDMLRINADAFTVTAVGKAGDMKNAALVSFWINFNGTRENGRVVLRTSVGKAGTFLLAYAPYGRTATPGQGIEFPVSDASSAFHHYAFVCDGDTLRVFVDGSPVPGRIRLPKGSADAFRARNQLDTFQVGQQLGGGCYSKNHALDNLAYWPRALTDGEIAADAGRFRLTGVAKASVPTATPVGGSVAALPFLPAGQPLPSAEARAHAAAVLDELFEGEKNVKAGDLLALLRDAESDASRHELLHRAERALVAEGRFADAFAALDLRARAFSGAVTDAEAAALLKEALRATAVKEPDVALGYARATLAFAETHGPGASS